jgi:hypothetical protein
MSKPILIGGASSLSSALSYGAQAAADPGTPKLSNKNPESAAPGLVLSDALLSDGLLSDALLSDQAVSDNLIADHPVGSLGSALSSHRRRDVAQSMPAPRAPFLTARISKGSIDAIPAIELPEPTAGYVGSAGGTEGLASSLR